MVSFSRIGQKLHRLVFWGALLLYVVLTAACSNTTDTSSSLEPVTLQLKWHHQFQTAGYYAALEQGFYRDAGLDVTIVEGGPFNTYEEVLSNRAQYGVSNTEVLLRRLDGAPLVALAAVFQHSPHAFMVRQESGITHPQELADHRLAMDLDARTAELQAALLNERVALDSIEFVDFTGDSMAFFLDDSIDAFGVYATNEPFFLEENGIPYTLISAINYGIDFYGDILYTSEDELTAHPERVARFREASLKGWTYAVDHPEELVDLILTQYNSGKSREHLMFEAETMRKYILSDLVEIGHMNPGRWQKIAETYESLGFIEPGYSLDGLIYNPNPEVDHTWFYWAIGIGGGLLLVLIVYSRALHSFNWRLQTAVTKQITALEQNKEQLRALLNNTNAAIWAVDRQYRLIFGNKAFQDTLFAGLGREIAIGESVLLDLLPAVEKKEWQTYYDRTLQGEIFQFERKISHSPQTMWHEYYFGPIKDKEGQIIGSTIVAHDITERKAKQDLLNKYKQIVAGTPDSISLVDTDYIYRVVNPAYMQRTKKLHDEIVGHSITDVMGADVFIKTIKPEFDACLRGKTIHYQEWFTYAEKGRRFMDVTYTPYQNEAGEIDGILVSVRDLTDIKQAEDDLHNEMARFQTVWQIASDAMVLSDENGIVINANPAYTDLYGYDLDEIIGHNFAIIFPEESQEWAKAAYKQVFTNPDIPVAFESTVQRRDGTIRQVESRINFLEKDGKRTAMLSTIRDTTEKKQTADKLLKITKNLETAQRIGHIGSWEWNFHTNTAHWSDEMYRIYGKEKVQGLPAPDSWLNAHHPDDHEILLNTTQDAIDRETPFVVEYRIFRESDGKERIIRSQGEVVRDETGQPVQLIGTSHDITERKQNEEALQAIASNLQALINAIDDSVLLIELDGTVVECNIMVAQRFGKNREDLLGTNAFDLVDTAVANHRRHYANQVISTGKPVRFKDERLGRIINNSIYPVKDANDQVIRLAIFGHDITEQHQLEQSMQNQARQMQQIINSVPEGVLVLDRDLRAVMANPVAINDLLFLTGQAPGEKLATFGNYPAVRLLEPLPEGMWHEVEYNGRIFEAITRPLTDSPESDDGWVLVINDVTRQRKIQTSIHRQERLAAIGQLAAGIAHDFNNILAVISLYSEVILNESAPLSTTRHRLDIIRDQVVKATDLTQQMLDFSRSARLQSKPLNFVTFLTKQIELLKRTLPENITIEFTYGINNYILKADPTRLQQVVMNLAINARDAMSAGGILHFSLKEFQVEKQHQLANTEILPAGLWTALAINDSGSGISNDVINHIFEPFFTTKEPGKGTGLGLAQVYGIVKQHGGEIVVKSQPGQGTTFTIYLPAYVESADETAESGDFALWNGNQETILIVEDQEILREVLVESLQSLNYRVITAANGEEALTIYKKQSDEIALVLSDMIMPGIGGEALFFKLKALNPDVKMIILTGYAQERELQKLRLQGLENWLFKPPSLEDLAQLVAQSLKASSR